MDQPEPFADEHEFCCNRPKGCPRAAVDGDGFIVAAPSGELVAHGETGVGIRFDAEQARELRKWLEAKGF